MIQIAACISAPGFGCAAISTGLSLATGGSVVDAIKAAAFAFSQPYIWADVGAFLAPIAKSVGAVGSAATAAGKAAFAAVKAGVHGIVGGAIAVAQGGNFLQGFAASAISGAAGVFSNAITMGNFALDTAFSAVVGCAGAVVSGGKCANGAVTAAFANIYNKWDSSVRFSGLTPLTPLGTGANNGKANESIGPVEFLGAVSAIARTVYAIGSRVAFGGVATLVDDIILLSPKVLLGRQGRDEFNSSLIKRLKKDMQTNGFDPNFPISAAKTPGGKHVIIDGHHRARAAGSAGISGVPVRAKNVGQAEADKLLNQATEAAQSFGRFLRQ